MSAAFVKNSGLKKTRDSAATRPYCARALSFYREALTDGEALDERAAYQRASQAAPFRPKANYAALLALFCVSLLGLSGCQADQPDGETESDYVEPMSQSATEQLATSNATGTSKNASGAPAISAADATSSAPTILVFGDSISAAYGIERQTGWAALLQERLSRAYPAARTINASVSGETTQGGRARLQAALTRHQPDLVYIELGGNDALRGYPVSQMTDNLTAMVTTAQNAGAQVVLLGMQIPPNYGPRYTRDFAAAFADVATATGAYLVPFFLEGVALEANMIQSDGIHPTTLAQPILLETGWQALVDVIGERYPILAKVAP